jgi:phospho-N-acetylmuramoyl-pentapeptide-transferase
VYSLMSEYPSFLVFSALIISFVLTILLTPAFTRYMRRVNVGQQVRDDGPETHLSKQGTPTMGGIVIVIAIAIAAWIAGIPGLKTLGLIAIALVAGSMGFVDDYKKVHLKNTEGMSAKCKLVCQFLIAAVFVLYAVNYLNIAPTLVFPFIGILNLGIFTSVIQIPGTDVVFIIPWLYLGFCLVLLVGMCNAVNLTDGLDGLAAGTVMMVMIVMAVIAYRGNFLEPSIFAAAAAGACAGFLWYNSHPASIFMGDTGSLSLGMIVGALSILTKTEVLIILIGGLFVAEALSVMIQVSYFKRTKTRIFLMAPLHHHFEKKGWGENKVVVRFWMISGLLAAVGFSIYFANQLLWA